jgi:hypothetical protein
MVMLRDFVFKIIWSKTNSEVCMIEAESKGQATRLLMQRFGGLADFEFVGEYCGRKLS